MGKRLSTLALALLLVLCSLLPALAATHTVIKGDNLTKIARQYNTQWQRIYQLNRDKIKNPNLILPGQVLILPEGIGEESVTVEEEAVPSEEAVAEEDAVETEEEATEAVSEAVADETPAEAASNSYPQSIGTPSILNSRDLGGYKTADGRTVVKGKLLRTGMLSNATPEDLARLESEYHVTAIIDLREPEDNETEPDPEIKGAKYYNIPSVTTVKWLTDDYYEETPNPKVYTADRKFENPYLQYVQSKNYDIAGYFASAYAANALDERSQKAYHDAFQLMLDNKDGATLFHCAQGKDRTGTLAAMILYVLGVDRDTIMEDYLLTNMYQAEASDQVVAFVAEETDDEYLQHQARLTNDVDAAYLNAFFNGCEQVYGDFDKFIAEGIGLTEKDIQALRDLYTE